MTGFIATKATAQIIVNGLTINARIVINQTTSEFYTEVRSLA